MASRKIVKGGGSSPSEFEMLVAQEIFNLEMSANELKSVLNDLYISAARELEVDSGRKVGLDC
jgi:small subunit ribosomal protein S7e